MSGDCISPGIFIPKRASIFQRNGRLQIAACFRIYCLTGYFNGLGRTTFVMIQGLCSIFLVKIPYAWFASMQPEPSLFQIGMSAAWVAVCTLLLCVCYYIHCRRKDKVPGEKEGIGAFPAQRLPK